MIRWLLRHKDGPHALRRALWSVAAGCTGFYALRYGLGRPVTALYAMFGALPLILFCELPGPARQRTRTLLAALPVSWLLVTAGTLLAVRPWAAACGMLVVGFLVSICAVGGPRLAALSIAFQLYYVLPCFPPYAPETLGSRLTGLTLGILLTALAERFIWPEPPPVPYRAILATAAAEVAHYTEAIADGPLPGPRATDRREAAGRALDAARLSRVPPMQRPTSPSVPDRAQGHTHEALRHVYGQLDRLFAGANEPHPPATALLHRVAAALHRVADELRTGTAAAPDEELPAALREFDAARAADLPGTTAVRLRQDAVVRGAAEAARLATQAARLAVGGPPGQAPEHFDYAMLPAAVRWWRRLSLHLTPHSVLLQNALRLAVALAAARLLVGALELSHGFWALLATLSLMRTSAADTRSALGPALLGTIAGAVLAAALLYAVGDVPVVYAAAMPVVFLVGFGVGPVLGPACMQLALTLAFILVFTQLSVPDWHLSGVRVIAVLVGGSVGAVASLLAWPRGGHGQLRRVVADFLEQAALGCRTVTALLCDGRESTGEPLRPVRRATLLAEAGYAQYRTEHQPHAMPDPHWGIALAAGYHMLSGGELMLVRGREEAGGPLPAEAAGRLTALAAEAADAYLRSAEALRTRQPSGPPAPDAHPARTSEVLRWAERAASGATAARVLLIADAEAWLTEVARDAARVRESFPAAAEG